MENGAERARAIVEEFVPTYANIAEYLAYADSFVLEREVVKYDGAGNVLLNLGVKEMAL